MAKKKTHRSDESAANVLLKAQYERYRQELLEAFRRPGAMSVAACHRLAVAKSKISPPPSLTQAHRIVGTLPPPENSRRRSAFTLSHKAVAAATRKYRAHNRVMKSAVDLREMTTAEREAWLEKVNPYVRPSPRPQAKPKERAAQKSVPKRERLPFKLSHADFRAAVQTKRKNHRALKNAMKFDPDRYAAIVFRTKADERAAQKTIRLGDMAILPIPAKLADRRLAPDVVEHLRLFLMHHGVNRTMSLIQLMARIDTADLTASTLKECVDCVSAISGKDLSPFNDLLLSFVLTDKKNGQVSP